MFFQKSIQLVVFFLNTPWKFNTSPLSFAPKGSKRIVFLCHHFSGSRTVNPSGGKYAAHRKIWPFLESHFTSHFPEENAGDFRISLEPLRYRNWGAQGSSQGWESKHPAKMMGLGKGQVTPKKCDESLVWYGKMFRRLESKKMVDKNYWKINDQKTVKHSIFIKRKEDKKQKQQLSAALVFCPPKICHQKKKTSQNSSSWRSEPEGFSALEGVFSPLGRIIQYDWPIKTRPLLMGLQTKFCWMAKMVNSPVFRLAVEIFHSLHGCLQTSQGWYGDHL